MKLDGINENTEHGNYYCEELSKLLYKEKESFEQKLIGDISHIHDRAYCHSGIEIESIVYQSNNEYFLEYSFDWHVYNGCADMEEQGTVEESVVFSVKEDGEININFLEVDERSTVDEF